MSNGGYSSHTIEKANKAKITIENFYTNFLQQQQEREERLHQCEEALGKFAFWFSTGELILGRSLLIHLTSIESGAKVDLR